MELLYEEGGPVHVIQAPLWEPARAVDRRDHLLVALTPLSIQDRGKRGLSWQLGQLYGVVDTGLITSKLLYRGLKRGMHVGDSPDAAPHKMAATWPAPRDAQLVMERGEGRLEFKAAPAGHVFCAYISPNQMLTEFPSVYGWLERWHWVVGDNDAPGAPIGWKERYDESVWPTPLRHNGYSKEAEV